MPTPDTFWTYLSTVLVYLLVLAIPGGLIGFAAGLRGWALAGLTPLLSYFAVGLAGPWLSLVGLPYNVATAAACTLLLAGGAYGLRTFALHRGWVKGKAERSPAPWSRTGNIAVIACVVLATAVSIIVITNGSDGMNAVFQRFDTVYHANGIRYIADTGDGSLNGLSKLNWYPDGSYYPNAYHLLGALVYSLTGTAIPVVLNAITLPIAGIFALSLAATVRQFGGRAIFAGSAALIASAASIGVYESVHNGLLTYAASVAITPVVAIALARFLKRPEFDTGMVLAFSAAGLFVIHASAIFAAFILAFPLVLQKWWRRESAPGRDIVRILLVGLATILLVLPHLLGAIQFSSGSYPYNGWGGQQPLVRTVLHLFRFWPDLGVTSIALTVLLVIGLITVYRLRSMRWIVWSALILAILFVLTICYGRESWVMSLSRPWWNEGYRVLALVAIPLCLLAAHGLAETQRLLAKLIGRWSVFGSRMGNRVTPQLVSAVLLVAALGLTSGGFYASANTTVVSAAFHDPQGSADGNVPVTKNEVAAMQEMEQLAGPGEKVLNDRVDGSVWLFAISGVRSVAAHYDPTLAPADAAYLTNHFREYATNPEVRAAVQRLNVHHVFLGRGAIFTWDHRGPGLLDLEGLPFLRKVYSNPDAVIYEIIR